MEEDKTEVNSHPAHRILIVGGRHHGLAKVVLDEIAKMREINPDLKVTVIDVSQENSVLLGAAKQLVEGDPDYVPPSNVWSQMLPTLRRSPLSGKTIFPIGDGGPILPFMPMIKHRRSTPPIHWHITASNKAHAVQLSLETKGSELIEEKTIVKKQKNALGFLDGLYKKKYR
jgi:hypothetical protein